MAKLTMERMVGTKTLAVLEKKEGSFKFNEATYVLTNQAFLDNNSDQEAAYFGYAVKVGDDIDELNGDVPVYKVEWSIIHPEVDDGSEACDWDTVKDVIKVGYLELKTGRLY